MVGSQYIKKMNDNESTIVKMVMSSKHSEPSPLGGTFSDVTYVASLDFIGLWTLLGTWKSKYAWKEN